MGDHFLFLVQSQLEMENLGQKLGDFDQYNGQLQSGMLKKNATFNAKTTLLHMQSVPYILLS